MRQFLYLPLSFALAACGGTDVSDGGSSSGQAASSSSSSSSSSASSSSTSSSASSGTGGLQAEFSSYSISTDVATTSSLPAQAIASYLAADGTTHIAWAFDYAENDDRIRYATYTAEGVYQEHLVSHDPVQLIGSVKLAVDDNGVAHIVWFTKRDTSVSGIPSGNYAVYYASNSGGSFSSAQVSENATDPTDNTDRLYNADVNGRPEVFLDGSSPYVLFTADASSTTSWDNWSILAQPAGSGFSLQQLINLDELEGTASPQHDPVVARQSSAEGPFVWMDISDYNVHALNGNGADNYLTGLGGFGSVTDVQAIDDGAGNTYAVWLRDYSDDTEGDDYAFYISKIENDAPGQPVRLAIDATNITGNFAPAAIDPVTGRFYLVYFPGSLGVTSGAQLVVYDPSSGLYQEVNLPAHAGVPLGEDSLWAYDNTLVYTTVSGGDTIHIHRWEDLDQRFPLTQ